MPSHSTKRSPPSGTPPATPTPPDGAAYLKILTALATASRTVTEETEASKSIRVFAERVSGKVSVGLNAIELVNET